MTGRDRSVPLLLAAGALVVAVVAVVLLVGVERPPAVEPLEPEAFEVPAALVWIDRDAGPALRVADPDGRVREVEGDPLGERDEAYGELLAWNDEGILVRDWSGGLERIVAIDPGTGARAFVPDDGPSLAAESRRAPGGGTVPLIERHDGRLTLRILNGDRDDGDRDDGAGGGGAGPVLWDTDAPASYDVVTAVPSPDGSVVALGDNAGRLLVVPMDGSTEPRSWTDRAPRYAQYVWEGTEPSDLAR